MNSELQTIYIGHISCSLCTTWVITILFLLIFGTTIPTSFNILMNRFLHLCHNQLFTVHHSDYYNLVPLVFGTTTPTSSNILTLIFVYVVGLCYIIIHVGTFLHTVSDLFCRACMIKLLTTLPEKGSSINN